MSMDLAADRSLWHLLQISDQFFPTGAYTFSHALEMYVAHGLVHDRASCQELLTNLAYNALGPCDLVFCAEAFGRAAANDVAAVVALDRLLAAFKTPRELRQESRHTGQAFLRVAQVLDASPLTAAFSARVRDGTTPGHHPIAFGLVARHLGLGRDTTLLAFLYNVCAAWVAAAVRLVPLGQTDGQRLLHYLGSTLPDVLRRYRHLTPDQAWSFTPGLDLHSMQHERLYSRLCRS
jgi:urease accessory protein